jgi:ribonucleoside-diphosphate reductase alpha chain
VTQQGIEVQRHFTKGLVTSPFDAVEWETRTARITSAKGEVIFEQEGVKVPKSWSVTATNIVASKYFWGKIGKPEREHGVDQMISRVVDTIAVAGIKQGYFEGDAAAAFSDELAYVLLNQIGAFNSPVWFNVGCAAYEPNANAASWSLTEDVRDTPRIAHLHAGYKHPQCSACFINAVEDSMEGIMELATTEAKLFKFGSGTGTNFSSLRSSVESVSGGGVASGPLSFMKGLDAFAGVIKSGGKTRRAAKMAILNADHPDIEAFIDCKLKEDKKAQALMREGYDGSSGPDSEAYSSVFYQNANNSVRASNAFMLAVSQLNQDLVWDLKAVKDGGKVGEVKAHALLRKIAQATWECGDPGMQFDDTINKWHTCKTSGRINASNPCSEYMFLDNSACNLASLNLLKFLKPDGTFDIVGLKAAVRIFIIAQDILVDLSGYPTEKIAKNSHDFRPLGLGFANLGALLMALGLPYDSDEGRAYAAAITAIMTGHAYTTSALLAKCLRPVVPVNKDLINNFEIETLVPICNVNAERANRSGACPGWFINKESFLDVIWKHQAEAKKLSLKTPGTLVSAAMEAWKDAALLGQDFGYRNAQVTVLAPTGTIGFLMDCDTTGIEPELSLIKYKKLVGGGQLKIVNETVPLALSNLGYGVEAVKTRVAHIDQYGSLENFGESEEVMAVFDTAFRPANGKRSIHYTGHIKMMAACQPFLSGAISKTVNLPNEATVADIEEGYILSWELGLKSVAIYRDGSKSNQVLVTKKEEKPIGIVTDILPMGGILVGESATTLKKAVKAFDDLPIMMFEQVDDPNAPPRSVRHRLPDTRNAVNHKFSIAGHDGYLGVGLYENGQPGEIFITMAKEGSTISGFMDSFALVFSIALQHGVPLSTLVAKLAHTRFEPSGWTGNPEIGYAKSIMDYLARWMELRFLKPQQGNLFAAVKEVPEITIQDSAPADVPAFTTTMDAPFCSECGALMVPSGACFKCIECGGTSGCS